MRPVRRAHRPPGGPTAHVGEHHRPDAGADRHHPVGAVRLSLFLRAFRDPSHEGSRHRHRHCHAGAHRRVREARFPGARADRYQCRFGFGLPGRAERRAQRRAERRAQ
ncbi:hypothetical protein [Streptomyces sp. SS]|uniref:hypothetical protein n=1 Tax=Streptomyces sp. SS TaxID=260742 RepID=UPI0002F49FFA|nr:hypothetical protein [Streptomyces sp. SS]